MKRHPLVFIPFVFAVIAGVVLMPMAPAPVDAIGPPPCDPGTDPDCGGTQPPDAGTLTVSRSGPGASHALITSSPTGIDCGATCSADFDLYSTVTLSASLDGGWSVTTWTGCASSTSASCTVTVGAATTVTASVTDISSPSVSLTSPTADGWYRGSVSIKATASDPNSGIAWVTFFAGAVNVVTDSAAPYETSWSSETAPNGRVTLSARAQDNAGNQSTTSVTVNVDNAGPSGSLSAPAEDQIVEGPIDLTVAATDGGSGMADVAFVVEKPDRTAVWTPGADRAAPWAIAFDPDTLGIADGSYRAYAVLRDAVGNGSFTTRVPFRIDRAAPTLSVESPAEGAFVSGSSADLSATATDAGGPATIRWSYREVGGDSFTTIGTGSSLAWDVGALPDGAYTVRAVATDMAGRRTTVDHGIRLDRKDPTATIGTLPAVTGGADFRVAWSGTDPGWTGEDSGVVSFQIRYRSAHFNDGMFGAQTMWLDGVDTGNFIFNGKLGTTYCFSTRARDWVGHWSSWSPERCTAVPLDDRAMTATPAGDWSRNASTKPDARYLSGTYSRSTKAHATLVRGGIQGTRVAILVTRCPTCGKVRVLWNGTQIRTVDLSATTTLRRQLIEVVTFDRLRIGTLTLEQASAGKLVEVDGIAVRRN